MNNSYCSSLKGVINFYEKCQKYLNRSREQNFHANSMYKLAIAIACGLYRRRHTIEIITNVDKRFLTSFYNSPF